MADKEKGSGKFGSILLFIIIPLIFLIIVASIVLWAAGVDVMKPIQETAAKTPVLKELVPETKETKSAAEKQKEDRTASLEKTIKEQKSEINILNKDLDTSKSEIDNLNQKIRSLKQEAEQQQKTDETKKDASGSAGKDKMINIYKSMDSGKAASIIVKLKEKEALDILNGLSKKQLAEILTKMTPEQAAKYTEKLSADGNKE
ncbi:MULTISPECIES: MotE family protein [Bacillus amyloliquefaciens group]|uniref:MotE family protein n=1 Tax=Bacillus amyloliquefaciens group TaxID=1938374 RepID=UPI0006491286|nr:MULTISPECIES: MotE family protein [Bacillus amyloliquefaciens group]MDQ8091249.1 MotE family protein [Bacillus amyloliquefaciens]QQD83646.1 MotE family protein [Bacillus siamensis]